MSTVYKVISKETTGIMDKGLTYEVVQACYDENMWRILGDSANRYWNKSRFSDPIVERTTKPLENVFIRVNGNDEKGAAIELLKSIGYVLSFYQSPQRTFMIAGDSEGMMWNVTNEWWNCAGFKELKVDKQTFIQPKTIFTLAKEKTYNVDGKELTRVEVEGIIADMDAEVNEICKKSQHLFNIIQGDLK